MVFKAARVLLVVSLLAFASTLLAAPGRPVGGVIVKGGKNPGGQMRVMATTDAAGKFSVRFAEGGEYTLEFDARSSRSLEERVRPGLQVEYVVQRNGGSAAERRQQAASAGRHTPFQHRLENARMVVTLPKGGGELRGVLQALPASDTAQASRSINAPGASIAASKPNGSVRK